MAPSWVLKLDIFPSSEVDFCGVLPVAPYLDLKPSTKESWIPVALMVSADHSK